MNGQVGRQSSALVVAIAAAAVAAAVLYRFVSHYPPSTAAIFGSAVFLFPSRGVVLFHFNELLFVVSVLSPGSLCLVCVPLSSYTRGRRVT